MQTLAANTHFDPILAVATDTAAPASLADLDDAVFLDATDDDIACNYTVDGPWMEGDVIRCPESMVTVPAGTPFLVIGVGRFGGCDVDGADFDLQIEGPSTDATFAFNAPA